MDEEPRDTRTDDTGARVNKLLERKARSRSYTSVAPVRHGDHEVSLHEPFALCWDHGIVGAGEIEAGGERRAARRDDRKIGELLDAEDGGGGTHDGGRVGAKAPNRKCGNAAT